MFVLEWVRWFLAREMYVGRCEDFWIINDTNQDQKQIIFN